MTLAGPGPDAPGPGTGSNSEDRTIGRKTGNFLIPAISPASLFTGISLPGSSKGQQLSDFLGLECPSIAQNMPNMAVF